MNYSSAPILETERLLLRPYRLEDFEQFAALYASPRSIHVDGPVSRADAWTLFAAAAGRWSLVGYGAWAIERRESGTCVGVISLNYPVDVPERELGWLLWGGFEGKGYAIEAAIRARAFAFDELGWSTAVSYIARGNDRSIRLATRMGAELDLSADSFVDDETLTYRHRR